MDIITITIVYCANNVLLLVLLIKNKLRYWMLEKFLYYCILLL